MVSKILNKIFERTSLVQQLRTELSKYKTSHPPGHFYSPIVDVNEVSDKKSEIFNKKYNFEEVHISSNHDENFINFLNKYYYDFNFSEFQNNENRFYYNNEYFGFPDGFLLFSVICENKPKKIIEIGSGFSSALMLDINSMKQDNSVKMIFIEPFPDRLNKLLRQSDYRTVKILESKVQNLDLDYFKDLEEGDILFIDSSHVCKTGSDVNYIIFDILPNLKKGVLIHFHDIFFPFEYPEEWVLNTSKSPYFKGFGWNEAYILRAFLSYNSFFEIIFFNSYFQNKFRLQYKDKFPLFFKSNGGSIWIKKTS